MFMPRTMSISEAAGVLQVTEKTIRNYIKRGFLLPDKWNGMWQIPEDQIVEIHGKKNGKSNDLSAVQQSDEIGVSKSEFSQHMQRAGKLEAFEALIEHQRVEISKMSDRIIQLESSSSAGWSEARSAQQQRDELKTALDKFREENQQLREEVNWLRREKSNLEQGSETSEKTKTSLLRKVKELEDQLYLQAIISNKV
jgi:chromosome segregation ATPase